MWLVNSVVSMRSFEERELSLCFDLSVFLIWCLIIDFVG